MTFTASINVTYEAHGTDHILPLIGAAYEDADPSVFQVAVVGINAYVSKRDWPTLSPGRH